MDIALEFLGMLVQKYVLYNKQLNLLGKVRKRRIEEIRW
jgi:hypothetical protein